MKTLFYGNQGRLRSGWRATLFLLTFFLLANVLMLAYFYLRPDVDAERPAGIVEISVPFAVATVVAVLLGWTFGRWFEGVSIDALGISLRWVSLRNFALGAVVGTVSFVFAVVIAIVTGSMLLTLNRESAPHAIATNALEMLVVFAIGAASEETFLRGYMLQTFVRSNVIVVGVVATSVLFSLAHLTNPSVNSLGLVNTFVAGIWFATAYLKTRDLWFPFGIHLAWNWLQGPIFGINVSGIGEFSPDPLMRAIDNGPAWLTGGAYGIEGGIACTFALVLSLVVIYYLPLKADASPAGS